MARSHRYLSYLVDHLRSAFGGRPVLSKTEFETAIRSARGRAGGAARGERFRAAVAAGQQPGTGEAALSYDPLSGQVVRLDGDGMAWAVPGGSISNFSNGADGEDDFDPYGDDREEQLPKGSYEDLQDIVEDALEDIYGDDVRVEGTYPTYVIYGLPEGGDDSLTYYRQAYRVDLDTDTVIWGPRTEQARETTYSDLPGNAPPVLAADGWAAAGARMANAGAVAITTLTQTAAANGITLQGATAGNPNSTAPDMMTTVVPVGLSPQAEAKWRSAFNKSFNACMAEGGQDPQRCKAGARTAADAAISGVQQPGTGPPPPKEPSKNVVPASKNVPPAPGMPKMADTPRRYLQVGEEGPETVRRPSRIVALAGTTEKPWDGSAGRWPDAASYCAACLIDDNEPNQPKTKDKCLAPWTPVLTRAGWRRADRIAIGDELLTTSRTWGRVETVYRRPYHGPLHLLAGAALTPTHPILTGRGWVHVHDLHPLEDRVYVLREPALAEALDQFLWERQDAPAHADGVGGKLPVTLGARGESVPVGAIGLDNHALARQPGIHDVAAHAVLRQVRSAEQVQCRVQDGFEPRWRSDGVRADAVARRAGAGTKGAAGRSGATGGLADGEISAAFVAPAALPAIGLDLWRMRPIAAGLAAEARALPALIGGAERHAAERAGKGDGCLRDVVATCAVGEQGGAASAARAWLPAPGPPFDRGATDNAFHNDSISEYSGTVFNFEVSEHPSYFAGLVGVHNCALPVKEPSGEVNLNAVRAASSALAGGRGGLKGRSAEETAKAKAAIDRLKRANKIGEYADSGSGGSSSSSDAPAASSVRLQGAFDQQVVYATTTALRLADGAGVIPEWQQLHKIGEWTEPHPSGQRIKLTRGMGDTMLRNYHAGVVRKGIPLDMRHGTDQDGVALAWQQDLRWGSPGQGLPGTPEPDGSGPILYGRFRYNRLGTSTLTDEQLKYLSPQYDLDYVDKESGRHYGPTLLAVAATNNPYLRIRSVDGEEAPPPVVLSDGLVGTTSQGGPAMPNDPTTVALDERVVALEAELSREREARHHDAVSAFLDEQVRAGLPPAIARIARPIMLQTNPRLEGVIRLSDAPDAPLVNLYDAVRALIAEVPRMPLGRISLGDDTRPPNGAGGLDAQVEAKVGELFQNLGIKRASAGTNGSNGHQGGA